jgi:hypothetical protein
MNDNHLIINILKKGYMIENGEMREMLEMLGMLEMFTETQFPGANSELGIVS